MTASPDPSEPAHQPSQVPPGGAPTPAEMPTAPLQVAPGETPPAPAPSAAQPAAPPTPAAVPPAVAPTSNDLCPNCNAYMARDQRYCLECGNRRGEPRLPFMDAVAFMDAAKQPAAAAAAPPPPPQQRPRISSSTSLIAGVATLVLAIGVGVLIGRSGDDGAPTAAATPQVVTVETGGGGGEAEAESSAKNGKGAKGKADKQKKANADLETGDNGGSEASEEILKPEGDVKLPPPEVQVGDPCEEGTAGCSGGKFKGDFFGE